MSLSPLSWRITYKVLRAFWRAAARQQQLLGNRVEVDPYHLCQDCWETAYEGKTFREIIRDADSIAKVPHVSSLWEDLVRIFLIPTQKRK